MIVDPSALIGILKREPEGFALSNALDSAKPARMSAASYVELGIVVDGWKDPVLSAQLDE
jgi:ribonuclease VapC